MSRDEAGQWLARVLKAENEALARGESQDAARFAAEKGQAAAALTAALAGAAPDAALAGLLRELLDRNGALLRQAIETQGRVLEMVARAARLTNPSPGRYGARGAAAVGGGAMALTLRA